MTKTDADDDDDTDDDNDDEDDDDEGDDAEDVPRKRRTSCSSDSAASSCPAAPSAQEYLKTFPPSEWRGRNWVRQSPSLCWSPQQASKMATVAQIAAPQGWRGLI